ncbi:MAG: valine--tRNA ligase [Verrucomicrobia bacterium]|nr:valine--tRNA ligase [Verrucomicrobiota bacterium]
MSEISKAYEPQSVESKWYQFWEDQGCFTADPARVSATRPAYSIVIPPPNVTGVLTMGHVLNNTIQDILARKARMDGKEVLWLPGTDHAGIATQNVVEKTLKKAGQIKHRDDLGREALVAKIWEWKETYGGIILKQLRALGASCDWTRTRFTMDPEYSRCVQKVFVDLYKKGLIYRGKRMVNWCPASLTALSDEEVVMKEQKGFMYHFRVEVVELPGTFLTIATTRPETIPADTAVAVNPNDPRYTHLVGKYVYRALPLDVPKEQRIIPIIADDHVTFDFGTGVLKVTPAHDKADFEIGLRHNLPVIDVLTPDGKLTAEAGADLAGLDRFVGRKRSAELLEAAGALDKAEPYTNNVGFSERADVPIEPRLSEQWFLKYPSVEASKACVAQPGSDAPAPMRFFPDRWAKVYDHWMGGIQDWCISRQLWWGHRIPVWYRDSEVYCGLETPAGDGWTQDPDVLDTWFSSWLWPFATMGWVDDQDADAKNATLKAFYPTTDLVTGPDIIFFWVARMIMAGYEYMGDLPFRNVYFTGIIRDKQGRKMSKSLGNSPDPLDLIAKYGADALRFGVMRAAPLGQDVLFDEQTVELGRNFCNKLWNACRFRQMITGEGTQSEAEINPALLTSDDRWVLLRLDQAIREVTQALAEYKFSDATTTLYRFFWNEYCDWYVEASKAVIYGSDEALKVNKVAVIDFVLGQLLRLFHPFLPFITEELWHGMGFAQDMPDNQGGKTLMFALWPKPLSDDEKEYFGLDDTADAVAQAKYDLVSLGRGLRRDCKIDPAKKIRFTVRPAGTLSPSDVEVLKMLLNAEALEVVDAAWTSERGTPVAVNALGELFLPLAGLIDLEAERARLTKELERVKIEVTKVQEKLANPAFAAKVPVKVLEEHQARLQEWQVKEAQIAASLANLAA